MAKHVDKKNIERLRSRVYEDYLLAQYDTATASDYWNDHKSRIEDFKKLYRGEWSDLYPSGEAMPSDPQIENIAKNGIHDLSALAAEVKPSVNFVREGETNEDDTKAELREAIAETHWREGSGDRLYRRLYMDVIGTGMALLAVTKKPAGSSPYGADYPSFVRLDPERCYPDVRNGFLQDCLYVERVRLRELQRMYPDKFGEVPPWADETVELIDYYSDYEVIKGVIYTKNGNINRDVDGGNESVTILDRWEHDLGCVPVAFVKLDTFDDAFRGVYDQAGPPLLARNRIVQFLIDYMEDMIYAPWEAKNIIDASIPPGPRTIYEHDPNAQGDSFMRRVAPAAPSGAVFGLAQYLEQQSAGETVQPPARQGQVTQSIASASFVASTQGRLTTVIRELQDLMSELRRQVVYIGFKIDEKWLDFKKPLVRPVGRKHTYKPSTDIKGWYHCNVEFGVAGGLDRMNADVRMLQHLGAKLISKRRGMQQVEYVPDALAEQAQIDSEDAVFSLKERLLRDPRMPLSVVARFASELDEGKDFVSVAREVVPELVEAEQIERRAAAERAAPVAAPPTGVSPEEQAAALAAGEIPEETEILPEIEFAPPPLQQQIVRALG